MATKKNELVKTSPEYKATKENFVKCGQARWDMIRLVQDVCLELNDNNCLESTLVHLCYEVVAKDAPFQVALKKMRELEPCTCDNDD